MVHCADIHVHLGEAGGKPVKVTASRRLRLKETLDYAYSIKGLEIIGIVDAATDYVLVKLQELVKKDELQKLPGGGFKTPLGLIVFGGAEVELDVCGRRYHALIFLPGLEELLEFNAYLKNKVTNSSLSTQVVRDDIKNLGQMVSELKGFLGLAHAFTPFKGYFGVCESLKLLDEGQEYIDFVELGLSAEVALADRIKELHQFPFTVGSDAHSLPNLGREFIWMEKTEEDFQTFFQKVFLGEIRELRGFNPRMGKYYRTRCRYCGLKPEKEVGETEICEYCRKQGLVCGVSERISFLEDYKGFCGQRPEYNYHLPLHLLPGFGPKTREQLYREIGSELKIIYGTQKEILARILQGKKLELLLKMRENGLSFVQGGAGVYGKVREE